MKYLIPILIFISLSCNLTLEDKIQGRWEVVSGGGFFFTEISTFEFSKGKVFMTQKSILGDITTPGEYSINDGKIVVGGYIFEFIDNNTLETTNLPILKFKMRKVSNK